MSKAPQAFRTISEVSETLDVPQHVLRFWEGKFSQIKPLKRAGGRRYYRPEDIELLRGVRALLYAEGYTIKGVQKLLRTSGVRYVCDLGRFGVKRAGRASPADLIHPAPEADAADAEDDFDLSLVDETGVDETRVDAAASPDPAHDVKPEAAPDAGASIGRELSVEVMEDLASRRETLEAALRELLSLRDMLRSARPRKADAA